MNALNISSPALAALGLSFGFLILRRLAAGGRRLPPGPRALPFIGSLLSQPHEKQWVTYQQWSKEYGSDVIYFRVFLTDFIVVNTTAAANLLLGKNAANYSDRPAMTMVNKCWVVLHFAFMPYGDSWREHRKAFNQELTPNSVIVYRPITRKWVHTLLQNLLAEPSNFLEHVQHMACGSSLELSYGLQVQPSGKPDPFIGAAKLAVAGLNTTGLFGTYLVDYFPFLRYLPSWVPLTRTSDAKAWRPSVDIAASVPFTLAKKSIDEGTAQPSITARLLSANGPKDENVIHQAGAALFTSGSIATVSAIQSFFLAMTLHPEVQKRAQAEIDQVVQGRLPDYSDEESLPYISAIIKEVLRWNPVVPLAFPHKLMQEDVYEGCTLPAGSVVLFNAWAMLHDPEVYASPMTFNPERFLTASRKLNTDIPDPDVAFGFARRVCPGRKLAMSTLWLTIASVLSLFEVVTATDEEGKVVRPEGDYTPGLLSYPKPFKCMIQPRSSEADRLVGQLPTTSS